MIRVAIVGGGIAGLAAAYELDKQRRAGKALEWHLYEASASFGGTVRTTRQNTEDGEWILEDGPDGWVTEKPWARELSEELGLGGELIASNDGGRKTYVWMNGQLLAMPEGMRMMVPEDLCALDNSPLFSDGAKAAYARELESAVELKQSVPKDDESVASFVLRHFGEEVLTKIAAPLLSGIFGGDVTKLSVQAVMPNFVSMEAEHGSLIAALQHKRRDRGSLPPLPTFTTLRRGMGLLAETIVAWLPADRLHTHVKAVTLRQRPEGGWLVRFAAEDASSCAIGFVAFDHVLLATPVDVTRKLLKPIDAEAADLIPVHASSAVLATFCWPAATAGTFSIPPGFGFLVPQQDSFRGEQRPLLAGTFTTQKFDGRAPAGGRILRVFFGGTTADSLYESDDHGIAKEAWRGLMAVLPDLPLPAHAQTTVTRWPRSLPQYEVGHGGRMRELEGRVKALRYIQLLGNGFGGIGVPDLIRDARKAARKLTEQAI